MPLNIIPGHCLCFCVSMSCSCLDLCILAEDVPTLMAVLQRYRSLYCYLIDLPKYCSVNPCLPSLIPSVMTCPLWQTTQPNAMHPVRTSHITSRVRSLRRTVRRRDDVPPDLKGHRTSKEPSQPEHSQLLTPSSHATQPAQTLHLTSRIRSLHRTGR
jgi:hypothetical protein